MTKTRIEAFSDGVLAIIITIMVLDLRPPHDTSWLDIQKMIPTFLSYILSFILIGVYWGNHHHLLSIVTHVNSRLMWANLHLLFWLSLVPFTTTWMGNSNFSGFTVSVYAAHQFCCGIAFYFLLLAVERTIPKNSPLISVLQKLQKKGIISSILFAISIPASFIYPIISGIIFLIITIMWWIPDRNIEKTVKEG